MQALQIKVEEKTSNVRCLLKSMLYKNDWEQTKKRYIEYWNLENYDRPIIATYAPKDGYKRKEIVAPEKIIDRWMDTEYVIKSQRESFNGTYFGGESFPLLYPNLGPDILGGILGCELSFGETTSWAEHFVDDWKQLKTLVLDEDNKYYKKIMQMTTDVINDSKGDYIVGITDLHPGMDGLVSLRGPENLCFDLIDCPEEVLAANYEILDVFKKVTDKLHQVITTKQQGSSNWMSIWHPEKWYVTSCDFMCMISKEMFENFVYDEIVKETQWLDDSIFHLDGPGALKHLDRLLEIPTLKGIQWVPGAGQPSISHWIPELKKIQDAGKMIQVYGTPEELDTMLDHLRPEGLMYLTWCKNEQESKDVIAMAEKKYKKQIY